MPLLVVLLVDEVSYITRLAKLQTRNGRRIVGEWPPLWAPEEFHLAVNKRVYAVNALVQNLVEGEEAGVVGGIRDEGQAKQGQHRVQLAVGSALGTGSALGNWLVGVGIDRQPPG